LKRLGKTLWRRLAIEILSDYVHSVAGLIASLCGSDERVYEYYRGVLSIVLSMDEPALFKAFSLIERYLRELKCIKLFIEEAESKYSTVHDVLKKLLISELELMKIHGALTLYSRLVFMNASLNYLIPLKPDISKYVTRIRSFLTAPTPPQADESRIVDLLKPGDTVAVIPGDIHGAWILEVFAKMLAEAGVAVKILLCSERYWTSLCRYSYRVFRDLESGVEVLFTDCSKLAVTPDTGLLLVSHPLVVIKFIENLASSGNYSDSGVLLAFNPQNTVLQKLFGPTPVVISTASLKSLLTSTAL